MFIKKQPENFKELTEEEYSEILNALLNIGILIQNNSENMEFFLVQENLEITLFKFWSKFRKLAKIRTF